MNFSRYDKVEETTGRENFEKAGEYIHPSEEISHIDKVIDRYTNVTPRGYYRRQDRNRERRL